MFSLRAIQSVGRLAANKTLSVQSQRTLYPHYLRYMVVNLGTPTPFYEKVAVYIGFMVGIMGPPTLVMWDVGKKRPKA